MINAFKIKNRKEQKLHRPTVKVVTFLNLTYYLLSSSLIFTIALYSIKP